MNPKDFNAALDALAELTALTGSGNLGSELHQLAAVFAESPEKTAAATLKKLQDVTIPADQGSANLVRVVEVLRATRKLAQRISSPKFIGLLDTFTDILERNARVAPAAFAHAAIAMLNAPKKGKKGTTATLPREEFVRRYVKRLEEALGDESFAAVHRELTQDGSITSAEVVAIAKEFTQRKPPSRPKALQAIWERHHTLMSFRSKSESRAGRSAA